MYNNLIEAKDIFRKFGARTIISNLSFTLKENEIVAIVGPSGSGKSTLLNILGLLDTKFEGELVILNEKIKKEKDYSYMRKDSIGFIFQSYYLLPGLSVYENIIMPFHYSNVDLSSFENKVMEISETLKLKEIIHHKVNFLSGGEKQRTAIARAIIKNPKIIICDEPTGNLDAENANIVFKALKQEADRGAGIIVVTHNYELAKQCNKTYFLDGGSLNEKV